MKIGAIFSDYDGTLAREDVPIESSAVPEEISRPLRSLASRLPVAVVTSKDYDFIHARTEFAKAWACVSGLEIVLSDGRAFRGRVSGRVLDGLEYAKGHRSEDMTFELKRSTNGELLGFSMDWRLWPSPSKLFIKTLKAELSEMGLAVVHDPGWRYIDVFGAKPSKGTAIRELKRLLNVKGKVLFLGDSVADNAAFDESDVAVCVEHGQALGSLKCRFVVRHEELGDFLRSLAGKDLSMDLRSIERKR